MSNYVPDHKDYSNIRSSTEGLESRLFKPPPGFLIDGECFYEERHPDSRYTGVPSQAEAEEAARRLRATFVSGFEYLEELHVFKEEEEDEEEYEATTFLSESEPCCYVPTSEAYFEVQEREISKKEWEKTPSKVCQTMGAGSSAAVAQYVELFHRNPDVQAAVISLVTDSAIWNAFVSNEKVQELMRRANSRALQCGRSTQAAVAQDCGDVHQERVNPLGVAISFVKDIVCDTIDSIVGIVQGVFGFIDKKIFGEVNADPLDQPLKACMVITILILALVIFSRSPRSSKSFQDRTSCRSNDT